MIVHKKHYNVLLNLTQSKRDEKVDQYASSQHYKQIKSLMPTCFFSKSARYQKFSSVQPAFFASLFEDQTFKISKQPFVCPGNG